MINIFFFNPYTYFDLNQLLYTLVFNFLYINNGSQAHQIYSSYELSEFIL